MGQRDGDTDRKFGHMVRTATQRHIGLKPFYGPEDRAGVPYEGDLGNPGDYPFH